MFRTRRKIWCLSHTTDYRYSSSVIGGTQSSWKEHYRTARMSLGCNSEWDIPTERFCCPICGKELQVAVMGRWMSVIVGYFLQTAFMAATVFFAALILANVESWFWKILWLGLSGVVAAALVYFAIDFYGRAFRTADDVPLVCFRTGEWGGHRLEADYERH